MASVASEEEHKILHKLTKGAETWIGGCRKSTSKQPLDLFSPWQFKGAEDWEWSDGTPFSFEIWSAIEPNNGSNNILGREDRVCMSQNEWNDVHSRKLNFGVYRKPRYSPPAKAILSLVTDEHVLRQCFAASNELRRVIVHMLYRVLSYKKSAFDVQVPVKGAVNGAVSAQQAIIGTHLEKEWPTVANAIVAIQRAPLTFSSDDLHRNNFLSHVVASSAILEASGTNAWKPLPESANDWSWPPAPLVPLRAAGKIVQKLGPGTMKAVWPVLSGAIVEVLVRMVDAVRAHPKHATNILTTIFEIERKESLASYHKQLQRARRDPTFPEFKTTAAQLLEQLARLKRGEYRRQTISSFAGLYEKGHALTKRYNDFLAALAHKCSGAKALKAPLKGVARALEKLVLRPGAADKIKADGVESLDGRTLVDVLRGSLECPDFTEIVFILDLLEILDLDLGDPKKAKQQGWDLEKFQIRIVHIKDRFTTPTSGGWADAMVNFSFVHGDDTQHVMELQLQVFVIA